MSRAEEENQGEMLVFLAPEVRSTDPSARLIVGIPRQVPLLLAWWYRLGAFCCDAGIRRYGFRVW
eukprot:5524333-Amphidinium_carterae.1